MEIKGVIDLKELIELILIVLFSTTNVVLDSIDEFNCINSATSNVYTDSIDANIETDLDPLFDYVYEGNDSEVCTYINVDSNKPILLVGDSRTVGLYQATKYDNISYLAKGAVGYSWLASGTLEYSPEQIVCSYIEANPEGRVIFNLGVNDICDKSKYINWVNKLHEKYPSSHLYYLSVNPAKGRSDLDIVGFNDYLQANISEGIKWLDSYTYLEETGFYAGDGVHYDIDTYYKILDFILANVGEVCYE